MNQEQIRLTEASSGKRRWKRWGPYLADRQWGTVREDYSDDGSTWQYLTHDMTRSKHEPELELIDTGIFDDDRYFDISIEYAKFQPEDIFGRITVHNRGSDTA